MTLSISEFIQNNYDIVFKSETLSSIEEVEEILLGDNHTENDEEINYQFICQFGEINDVIILEANQSESSDEILKKHPKLQQLMQKTKKKFLQILGWDAISSSDVEIGKVFTKKAPHLIANLNKNIDQFKDPNFKCDKQILAEHIQKQSEELSILNNNFKEMNERTFPGRTKKLITSLEMIAGIKILRQILRIDNTLGGFFKQKLYLHPFLLFNRTILQSGKKHLQESDSKLCYNLDALRVSLNQRKAIILFPKRS